MSCSKFQLVTITNLPHSTQP
uniref:Uncharacterized protein n=1 Tax=Arundo donax TaxID=35708 RepID=A0A0A9C2Q4_ARUDO